MIFKIFNQFDVCQNYKELLIIIGVAHTWSDFLFPCHLSVDSVVFDALDLMLTPAISMTLTRPSVLFSTCPCALKATPIYSPRRDWDSTGSPGTIGYFNASDILFKNFAWLSCNFCRLFFSAEQHTRCSVWNRHPEYRSRVFSHDLGPQHCV